MVKNSLRDALSVIGPALAQWSGRMHPRRRRAVTLGWAIAFLLIASLVGTGLLVSSFHTSTPPRERMVEAPTSTVASNVVPNHSPAVSESHTSTRTKTIARAQQQLNSLADSSELADLQLDLGSESQPLLSARAHEFDVEAFVWSLPNADFAAHGDFAYLQSPADASSMLLSGAGNGLVNRSVGGGGLGFAGLGGGGAAPGGGSAGGPQGGSALLAAQGPPNGVTPGAGGNATGGGGENTPPGPGTSGTPGRSGDPGTTQGTSQTNLQQPNSPSGSSNTVVPVPEPATLLLMGVGLSALSLSQRRRRQ